MEYKTQPRIERVNFSPVKMSRFEDISALIETESCLMKPLSRELKVGKIIAASFRSHFEPCAAKR